MKYKKIYLAVLVFVIALGIVLFYRYQNKPQFVLVASTTVKKAPFTSSVHALGSVVAEQGVGVSAKISGIISDIHFQAGQTVKKGDLLFSLENGEAKAKLEQSLAQLNLAKLDFDRYELLFKSKTTSQSEYDKFLSQYNSMKAQADYETALVNQTYIRAPFDGKVGVTKVSLGQYISPGQALVNLQSVSPLYVDFNISEAYSQKIHIGARVLIKGENMPKLIQGQVVAFEPSIDVETRTLAIRAKLEDEKSLLLPGMAVEVDLMLNKPENHLWIPQAAITYGAEGEYVYKVHQHQIEKVKVLTGAQQGLDILVLQGLNAGDEVVCAGQIKLHPGVLVNTQAYLN